MKRLLGLILALLVAAPAAAQWPGYTVKSSGSSSITSGSTVTSGCTAGGVLFSSSSTVVCSDTDLTFNGTTLTATGLTVTNAPTFSALTSGRVPYATTAGLITDSANLTFSGNKLSVAGTSGDILSVQNSESGASNGPVLRVKGVTSSNGTGGANVVLDTDTSVSGAYLGFGGSYNGTAKWQIGQRGAASNVDDIGFYLGSALTGKMSLSGTVGDGLSITAGTAATNARRALSISQTWTDGTSSNIAALISVTNGTATGNIFSVKGGAAGTTARFDVDSSGNATAQANMLVTTGWFIAGSSTGMYWAGNKSYFSSPADGNYAFAINADTRRFFISSRLPVIGACGTDPAVAGVDSALVATVGTGGVATSCAVTFNTAKTTAPSCVAISDTDIVALKLVTSTTAVTVTATAPFTAGSKLHIHCFEYL